MSHGQFQMHVLGTAELYQQFVRCGQRKLHDLVRGVASRAALKIARCDRLTRVDDIDPGRLIQRDSIAA